MLLLSNNINSSLDIILVLESLYRLLIRFVQFILTSVNQALKKILQIDG